MVRNYISIREDTDFGALQTRRSIYVYILGSLSFCPQDLIELELS